MSANANTKPEYWIEQWHALNARNTVFRGYSTAHTWNRMAARYDKDDEDEKDKRETQIAETCAFLKREGVSFKGSRILDIGCGPGRFTFAFAERGAQVVCIDSAENMIVRLREEMPESLQENITSLHADWHTLDLEEHGFTKAFDLVFANMTPAVMGPETFLKLMDASRQWCWFRGWAGRRENKLLEGLHKELFNKESDRFSGNFIITFNLVYALGFFPSCTFQSIGWTRRTTVSEAIEFYSNFFHSGDSQPPDELREKITRYLEKTAKDGYIEYAAGGHTGAMLWNIGDT